VITKIRIRTPKGQAKKANKKIRKFIIGFNRVKLDSYVNKADSEIIWSLEGKPRAVMKIIRNVGAFGMVAGKVLGSKTVKRVAKKGGLGVESIEEVKKMFEEGTRIKVIKAATAQEIEDGKTWFDRIKEKYVKFTGN